MRKEKQLKNCGIFTMKFTHFSCHQFLRPHFQESKSNYVSARKERMKKRKNWKRNTRPSRLICAINVFFLCCYCVHDSIPVRRSNNHNNNNKKLRSDRTSNESLDDEIIEHLFVSRSNRNQNFNETSFHIRWFFLLLFFCYYCSHSSMNVQQNASMKLPFSDDVMSWWTLIMKRMRMIKLFDCVYLTTL